MTTEIPVVVFAYRRVDLLERLLKRLRADDAAQIIVFADGAKGDEDKKGVAAVRAYLGGQPELKVFERDENWGLGRNILEGVSWVAKRYDAFLVFEDDLEPVSGCCAWMKAALRHYEPDDRVMSVTGWTHPRLSPELKSEDGSYFDGRAAGLRQRRRVVC